MKRLSPVVRKIIAVYLGFLLLALLFVPGGGDFRPSGEAIYIGYVFLPKVFFSDYYVNYEALRLEIEILTIGAAFALAAESLLSHKHKEKEGVKLDD